MLHHLESLQEFSKDELLAFVTRAITLKKERLAGKQH